MESNLQFLAALKDIVQNRERVAELTKNVSYETYQNDFALIWSVERGLSIIGEAATRIRKLGLLDQIPNADKIIGFRNILVHAYDNINQPTVWRIVRTHLPALVRHARSILDQSSEEGDTSFNV